MATHNHRYALSLLSDNVDHLSSSERQLVFTRNTNSGLYSKTDSTRLENYRPLRSCAINYVTIMIWLVFYFCTSLHKEPLLSMRYSGNEENNV